MKLEFNGLRIACPAASVDKARKFDEMPEASEADDLGKAELWIWTELQSIMGRTNAFVEMYDFVMEWVKLSVKSKLLIFSYEDIGTITFSKI